MVGFYSVKNNLIRTLLLATRAFLTLLNLEDSENIYSRGLPAFPTQEVSGGPYLLRLRYACRYRDLEGYEVIVLDSKRDWTWPWWTWLILGVFILMVLTCITKAAQFYSFLVANSNSSNSNCSSVSQWNMVGFIFCN